MRIWLRLTVLVLISSLLLPAYAGAAPSITTHAEAAALIDVQSGRILYSHQGDKPMRIASLTKIMTAIVAIENGRLTDNVKVSKNAAGKEGSSIYLKLGEEMTLGNMLYGLMLRSGNDAATAIAEHVGGSLDGFAYLMNQEARFIGMPNSSFKNPSGLDEDGHRASANDMARLTAHALKNPVFQEIVKTKVKKAPNPNESWDYTWLNKNKMLSIYEGADGVKTGYTKLAKRCLVSSATRNGQQLAVVTLNDGDDWADHARLFDYGFKNFPHTKVIGKGDKIQGSNAVAGTTFNYPTASEEAGGFTTQAVWTDSSTAQYRLGERGKLIVYLAKNQIGQVPLYDAGSPAMKGVAESAFGVKDDDSFSSTAAQIFALVRALARALFTGVTG